MTAHDMMVFAVHSIAVLERFVPEEERECDVWRCWCLHVEYFTISLSQSFPLMLIVKLDVTIWNMQKLYLSIPENDDLWGSLWAPNNH